MHYQYKFKSLLNTFLSKFSPNWKKHTQFYKLVLHNSWKSICTFEEWALYRLNISLNRAHKLDICYTTVSRFLWAVIAREVCFRTALLKALQFIVIPIHTLKLTPFGLYVRFGEYVYGGNEIRLTPVFSSVRQSVKIYQKHIQVNRDYLCRIKRAKTKPNAEWTRRMQIRFKHRQSWGLENAALSICSQFEGLSR